MMLRIKTLAIIRNGARQRRFGSNLPLHASPVLSHSSPLPSQEHYARFFASEALKSKSSSNKKRKRKQKKQAAREEREKAAADFKKAQKLLEKARRQRGGARNHKEEQVLSSQKQARLRSAAAQVIPYWLRRDPAWRERTMQTLNLPTGNTKKAEALLHEYRHFYFDSLPSFSENMERNPPKSLHDALDRLVEAGFADPTWAKNYRQMKGFQIKHLRSSAAILDKQRELKRRQKTCNRIKRELESSQERYNALPEPEPEPSGLVQQVVSAVKTFFRSEEELESAARQQTSIRNKRLDLERKMKRKQAIIDSHKASVEASDHKLSKLKEEKEAFQPPLSTEEYEQANAVVREVMDDICVVLAKHIAERHSQMLEQYKVLDAKTDLTRPAEWFPRARLLRRKIIYHGGPTNSGKTYAALERLKHAKKGMYLGPLRLLAAEIYEKLTVEGIYCNLYTGQEKREIAFATHGAATIEMASLVDDFDVIVIDEIQMIADKERGFAWTRALLGSQCKEIHVCGGLEARDIIEKIVAACGDDFELRTYERFTSLHVANRSLAHRHDQLGSYRMVQPGDCVVAFSRNDIFAIKREIEKTTNHKCCVIYGSLPPRTRSEQARRFNDPNSGYDVLVASDAIGMGLNLNIRRIILNSMYKNDGTGIVQLDHSAVKQISGRAGRRNSPYPTGEVTCRDPTDMQHLRNCMSSEIEPIQKAGLLPTASHIEQFSEALVDYGLGHGSSNLHKTLLQFSDMATVKSDYFLCRQTPMQTIARSLAAYPLPIRDKYTLCMCPVIMNSNESMDVMKRFAAKLAKGEVSGLTRNMLPRRVKSFEELARLCSIFAELDLFLWLQNKFPPGNMMEEQNALKLKETAIKLIDEGLGLTEKLKLSHCYIQRDLRIKENFARHRDSNEDDEADIDDDWNKGVLDL